MKPPRASRSPSRSRRIAAGGALALGLAAAALGCRSRPTDHAENGDSSAASKPPGLSLTLTLAPDQSAVDVELRATGPAVAAVRELCASRGWGQTRPLNTAQRIEVRDAAGPIPLDPDTDRGTFSVIPLRRAPSGGELIVRYTARTGADVSRFALHRSLAGVSGVGHAFLVRPVLAASLPLAIQLRGAAGVTLATSLDGRPEASPEDLAEAVYVAGSIHTDTLPSGDRAVLLGSAISGPSAIDLSRKMGSALAPRLLDGGLGENFTNRALFFIGEKGIQAEHDGADLGPAVAVWLDADRALDAGAKIVLAHETLHRVFGRALQVGEAGRGAEWFSEGFTTHYARKLLFDAGEIDAAAFLADVARADDERTESAGAGDDRAMGYGRGARYAAMIDAAVRSSSAGARSLDDVLVALAGLSRKAPGAPVPVKAFRSLVAAEVGDDSERALWNEFAVGAPPELPESAFGPCFRRVTESVTVPDLGFDPASLAGRAPLIRGTVAGSAAARAGVKDGAVVLRSSIRPTDTIDPTKSVELVLAAPGGKKKVRYRPVATKKQVVFKAQACKR